MRKKEVLLVYVNVDIVVCALCVCMCVSLLRCMCGFFGDMAGHI